MITINRYVAAIDESKNGCCPTTYAIVLGRSVGKIHNEERFGKFFISDENKLKEKINQQLGFGFTVVYKKHIQEHRQLPKGPNIRAIFPRVVVKLLSSLQINLQNLESLLIDGEVPQKHKNEIKRLVKQTFSYEVSDEFVKGIESGDRRNKLINHADLFSRSLSRMYEHLEEFEPGPFDEYRVNLDRINFPKTPQVYANRPVVLRENGKH